MNGKFRFTKKSITFALFAHPLILFHRTRSFDISCISCDLVQVLVMLCIGIIRPQAEREKERFI